MDTLSDDNIASMDIEIPLSTSSGNIAQLKKKCEAKQVAIICYVLCNIILTLVSLVVAVISIRKVLHHKTQQAALSAHFTEVIAQVDNNHDALDNFTNLQGINITFQCNRLGHLYDNLNAPSGHKKPLPGMFVPSSHEHVPSNPPSHGYSPPFPSYYGHFPTPPSDGNNPFPPLLSHGQDSPTPPSDGNGPLPPPSHGQDSPTPPSDGNGPLPPLSPHGQDSPTPPSDGNGPPPALSHGQDSPTPPSPGHDPPEFTTSLSHDYQVKDNYPTTESQQLLTCRIILPVFPKTE